MNEKQTKDGTNLGRTLEIVYVGGLEPENSVVLVLGLF